MAYENLISAVQAVITDNANNEVTGQVLRELIVSQLIPQLGDEVFAGEATPTTNPGAVERETVYFATRQGTYANLGGITLNNELAIIRWDNGTWVKQTLTRLYDAFTQNSPLVTAAVKKVTCDNAAAEGKTFYLTALENSLTQLLLRIEEGDPYTIVGYYKVNMPTEIKKGRERILIPEYQSSGYNFYMDIDWDELGATAYNVNGAQNRVLNIVREPGSSSEAFPFETGTSISPYVDLQDLTITNTKQENLLDADGNPLKLKLSRCYNWEDVNQGDFRALLEFSDENDNVVARYYEPGRVNEKAGVSTVLCTPINSGGITIRAKVNWDALGGQTLNVNYPISKTIIYGALTSLSQSSVFPFELTEVRSEIDIIDVSFVSTDQSDILDADGNPKRLHLSRVYNWEDVNQGDFRALVQFEDDTDTVVARYFEPGRTEVKTGIGTVVATPMNSSGISLRVKINWDALAGSTFNITYPLDTSIVYGALNSQAGSPVLDPFASVNTKKSQAIDLCSSYLSKLLAKTEDVNVVLLGDSLTARTASVTQLDSETLKTAPVWLCANTWAKYLFDYYFQNKPEFERYDSGNFTEVGASWVSGYDIFEGSGGVPSWARPNRQDGNSSRYTTDANASVEFDWDLDAFEFSNFIYDKDYRADNAITLGVSGGNGRVEVYNGAAWVEANGYVLNQYINPAIATEGSGYALSVNKVRLKMRSIGTGSATISFTKGNNADYIFYWGLERWNEQTMHLHNAGRGGHDAGVELPKSALDLADYNPDLIIFQLPLINEINSFGSGTDIVNHIWDFVWGDRPGNLNANSLVNLYPGVDIVCTIPHIDAENWQDDTPVIGLAGTLNDDSGYDVAQRCKALFLDHNDIGYIDILEEQIEIAKINGWTIEQAFTGTDNSTSPTSFNRDNSHQNDYGSKVWASVIIGNMKY